MSEENRSPENHGDPEIEKRGLAADALQAGADLLKVGAGAAFGSYVTNKLSGGGEEADSPPSPPQIELPPGVDRE